ncbi:MAG: maleylacetate reductase [Rhodospirillum sp.]|nr:maleylacetate reductase [Rhodospirillum sp.]
MRDFVYDQLASRVVFGAGAFDKLAAEVDRLGLSKLLVLSTPGQVKLAEEAARRLGARAGGLYPHAKMHVPIETAQAARAEARRLGADGAVAIGGGSTIGLGKAIALESGLPIVAIPTTYAGSEMTPIYGLTEGGAKKTGRDAKVLPRTVIYDPLLTLGLPAKISGPSGMNAIAHCVEALYAENANPVLSLMAEEGIRTLARSLPRIAADLGDLDARGDALYGAWLAGISLGAVGMALHHKLCHTLGGSFNLPHAETHTIVLPHAAAYNSEAAPEAMRRIAHALGGKEAATGLYDLAAAIGAPLALKEIGFQKQDLDQAAEIATRNPYYNPRPVSRDGIRRLLDDAFHGRRPG